MYLQVDISTRIDQRNSTVNVTVFSSSVQWSGAIPALTIHHLVQLLSFQLRCDPVNDFSGATLSKRKSMTTFNASRD